MIGQLRIIAWLASPSVLSYSFLVLGRDQGQSSFMHTHAQYFSVQYIRVLFTHNHKSLISITHYL